MELLSAELEQLQSKPTIGAHSARMTRDQLPMAQRVYTVITDHNQLIADTIEAAQHIEEEAIDHAYLPPPEPKPLIQAREYAQHLIDYAREQEFALDKMRQKQMALEQAEATFHPTISPTTVRLAQNRRGGQKSNTFDRLFESPTKSSGKRVQETLQKSPQTARPQSATGMGSPKDDLRIQLDRLLDRMDELDMRRARPENRRQAQQMVFDEEKAQLELKIKNVRERLERLNRRMSPDKTMVRPGSASPGSSPSKTFEPSPEDRDRTLGMLMEQRSPVDSSSPKKVNTRAVKHANKLYYDGMRQKRATEKARRDRLAQKGFDSGEITKLLKPSDQPRFCFPEASMSFGGY